MEYTDGGMGCKWVRFRSSTEATSITRDKNLCDTEKSLENLYFIKNITI